MSDIEPIVTADLRAAKFTLAMHMRLGKGGFMRVVNCVEYPRLSVSKGRATFREPVKLQLFVDQVECAGLDAAAAALNKPAPEQAT